MATTMKDKVLKGIAAVGVVCLVGGVATQDWKCFAAKNCDTPTEGATDASKGTIITYFVLAVATGVMAFFSPRAGVWVDRLAFAFSSLAFLALGLVHLKYSDDVTMSTNLYQLSLLLSALGGLWRVYMVLTSTSLGEKYMSGKMMLYVFVGISVAQGVLVYLSRQGTISVPDWTLYILHQFTYAALIGTMAVLTASMKWALAIGATFVPYLYIHLNPPVPFSSSATFNSQALANSVLVLYFAAVYGFVCALTASAGFTKIASASSGLVTPADKGGWGRCCSCAFGGK